MSGITGINHKSEEDIIDILSHNKSLVIIKGGSHGKSTVLKGEEVINFFFS